MKILIVDDSPFITAQAKDMILSNNINAEIYECYNGDEAQNILEKDSYDILLIDVVMPGKSGIEVVKSIRRMKEYGDIYIIVMTSINKDNILREAFDSGANDFIRKPFDENELISRLKAAFRLRSYQYLYKTTLQNLQEKNKELATIANKLKETQDYLIHSEKMSAIGQIAAGIAHEINNPLGFISTNFETLYKYSKKMVEVISSINDIIKSVTNFNNIDCEKMKDDISNLSQLIHKNKIDYIISDIDDLFAESQEGIERVTRIVQSLRRFARSGHDSNFTYEDINDIIDETLIIAKNEIKYKIDIIKEYDKLPQVYCNRGEIGQVVLNIIINAVQAIKSQNKDERGHIIIKTWYDEENVYFSIKDDGPGIKRVYLSKIFEPFFTTKEVGQGTGLGLSISYDIIVNKHKGNIKVFSEEGNGAEFIVNIPRNNEISDNN
ncbi:response regulator [Caldicellulosiruptoraceae bacterium PP1]